MAEKKSPSKKRAKKTTRKTAKKGTLKPKSVKKQKVEKLTITDGTDKGSAGTSAPLVKEKIEIALLSPLRFPVNYDHLAANTARYAGAFFVIVGAVFTMLNMQYIDARTTLQTTYDSQAASLICETLEGEEVCYEETLTSQSDLESKEYCSDPYDSRYYSYEECNYTGDSCSSELHPEYDPARCDPYYGVDPCTSTDHPDYRESQCAIDEAYKPDIDYWMDAIDPELGHVEQDNGYSTVSGVVEFFVSVDTAERVDVSLRSSDGTYTELEAPYSIDERTWKMNWDTRGVKDGEYALVIGALSGQDEFIQDGEQIIAIANQEIPTRTMEPTEDEEEELPPYSVALEFASEDPFKGKVGVIMLADRAEKVTLFVDGLFAGEAKHDGGDRWTYLWDTTRVKDGDHTLYAKAYFPDNATLLSIKIPVEVHNEVSDPVLLEDLQVEEVENVLSPEIILTLGKQNPVSGDLQVTIHVPDAKFVELYGVPEVSLTPHFLGLARQTGENEWTYTIDTTQGPNGNNKLFARVRNSFGLYDSKQVLVTVQNELRTQTVEETTYVRELKEVQEEVDQSVDTILKPVDEEPVETEPTDRLLADVLTDEMPEREKIDEIIAGFEQELRALMQEFARAIRSGDTDLIEAVQNDIRSLREQVIEETRGLGLPDDLVKKIDASLQKTTDALRELTERNERIIQERVGDALTNDSDNDGITDYDEVNLYKTDPFAADSDNDGFTDGSEVLGGFNPADPSPEAFVNYESPQEKGTVHEDVLSIDSIETVTEADTATTEIQPKARISGKGLPNSFVTLYIFSTPIVVTVKTDDDGSWEYTFDKELENGEHEVYVGITDNAGRIVAKSNPLRFVKTAQAFTQAEATPVTAPIVTTQDDAAFLTWKGLLVIASLCVVGLGLVLILLGMHIRERRGNQLAHED